MTPGEVPVLWKLFVRSGVCVHRSPPGLRATRRKNACGGFIDLALVTLDISTSIKHSILCSSEGGNNYHKALPDIILLKNTHGHMCISLFALETKRLKVQLEFDFNN
jgi:hypothetical protein